MVGLMSLAQPTNFSVEATDTTLYGSPSVSDFYGDIDLTNNTPSALNMGWVESENNIPSGWQVSYCDPYACRPIGVSTATFQLFPVSGQYINVHFYPNGISGSGYVRVQVYETTDPSNYHELTYYGVADATGMVELSLVHGSMDQNVPNPFKIETQVNYELNSETGSIVVYDMTGKVVEEVNLFVSSGTVTIGKELEPGVYVYCLYSDSTLIDTKRMVAK